MKVRSLARYMVCYTLSLSFSFTLSLFLFHSLHPAYGITTDGHTTFVNASTCNLQYRPVQAPIIFDLPSKK